MSTRTEWEAQCDYWDSITKNINREDSQSKIYWMNGYDWAKKTDNFNALVALCEDKCLTVHLRHRGDWKVVVPSNPSHGLNEYIVSVSDCLEIACASALQVLQEKMGSARASSDSQTKDNA